MSEKTKILAAIKLRMRRDGMTYASLAKKLSVSEVTVKRYFSEQRLSLDSLDEICSVLNVTLDELMAELKASLQVQKEKFTQEQELALAKDEFLFILFYVVARKLSYQEILKRLSHHKPSKIIRGLRALEALQLVDFETEEKLRALVSSNAEILPHGPLWNRYSSVAINEFFASAFTGKNEFFDLSIGFVSKSGHGRVRQIIEKAQSEIHALLRLENSSSSARREGEFLWIASCYRPVGFSMLEIIAEKSQVLSGGRG